LVSFGFGVGAVAALAAIAVTQSAGLVETSESLIERLVHNAVDLRAELIASAGRVHPNNMADDGVTTVQAALVDLRAVIDAFLKRDDPDNEITGWASTE
jgi:hypothetical protein